MSLTAGERLGAYEILAEIGQGGMGVVYKARDTRLGRLVAIKVLPEHIANREGLRQRFEREARAVASLNHPHICVLYDIGNQQGTGYIVLEYLEGETLAARIGRGALPIDQALKFASQTADALDRAHRAGVTHRDVKPANLMLTRDGVKVLDFGLAKAAANQGPDAETLAAGLTAQGTVMGTPHYMAPEQIEGKEADSRSDIWSCGVVLHQMLTGKLPFRGQSFATLSAEILKGEPPQLENVPPQLVHVIDRCLAKDPEDRWQSARDLKLELDFVSQGVPVASVPAMPQRSLWLLALAVIAVAGIAAVAFNLRSTSQESTVVPLTSSSGSEITPSFSPDGTQVAFAWNGESGKSFDIYVKQIGPGAPFALTKDPANELMPKWSPDGKWIAFLRQQSTDSAAVYVVPSLGGMERKLAGGVNLFSGDGYWGNRFDNLDWSPDGRWLVVSKKLSPEEPPALVLLSFETGESRVLLPPLPSPSYAAATFAPDGRALAYWREPGALMILPLSETFEPKGAPKEIALGDRKPAFIPSLCWSADSRDILFSTGTRENAAVWRVSASGTSSPQRVSVAGDGAADQAVSRRGEKLVFSRYDKEFDIWSLNLDESGKATGPAVRAFNSSKTEMNPHFSPDGTKVALASNRSGNDEIWVCLSDGSNCSQLTNFSGPQVGTPRWSPDGNWIAFDVFQNGSSIQIIGSGGGKPRRLTNGLAPRWSNDGMWIYSWCLPEVGTCRIPVAGGKVEKILDVTSIVEFSPDGAWLYYLPNGPMTALQRMPVSGGASEKVFSPLTGGQRFAVTNSGVFFAAPDTAEGGVLQYYDFASKSARTVYRVSRPSYSGFTISPDQRRILFGQIERPQSHDLVLVEPYK